MAERILAILHFRCCNNLSVEDRIRIRHASITTPVRKSLHQPLFSRGLPSLDILFGYSKRTAYRILVQDVNSSDRSFTKKTHNYNNIDISVEQEINLEKRVWDYCSLLLSSTGPCGWEFAYIFVNCCFARQRPIMITLRNSCRYSPRGTYKNNVINTYSLFNGILNFASKNKAKHFVIRLLWLEKANWS
jgi:hypothetical protein